MLRVEKYLSPPIDLLVRFGTAYIYIKLGDSAAGVSRKLFIGI